jgi:hypothetical protein
MIDRPFNQIRDTFKDVNTKNKDLVKYVFEKSDSISLWIIGLAIGGISIFANDIGKVKSAIPASYLSSILYLLATSVTAGILYRIFFLRFYVILNQISDGIDISFTRRETMDTESFLKGDETYEGLLLMIKNGTGEDLNYLLPLYNNSDDNGKRILYDNAVKHYLANVEFAKRDTELAFDFVADTYSKFTGADKENYKRKMTKGNSGREFKSFKVLTLVLYIIYNLAFIIALFLFAASA